jgi:hypothetical protein
MDFQVMSFELTRTGLQAAGYLIVMTGVGALFRAAASVDDAVPDT